MGSCIEEFIDSPNDINRFRNVPLSSADIERKKYIRNPFNHMTVAFKKDIIINAGGYVDMPGYEDYYLWLRVLRTHKGKNLKNSLVYARVGNNMIGRRHGYDFFKNELRFQLKLLEDNLQNYFGFFCSFFGESSSQIIPKIY